MNGLYPIIRRVRRPLLQMDPPAENKPPAVNAVNEEKPAEPKKADEKETGASGSDK